jgi:hypothetical protein
MFVWYQGCNKAWCGYTGGVVFSRAPSLPPSLRPSLEAVAKKVGIEGGMEGGMEGGRGGMCLVHNDQCSLR